MQTSPSPATHYAVRRPHFERPCAAPGLLSYRYPNNYGGWCMIGATDDVDALKEAARSVPGGVFRERLQVWDSFAQCYVPAVRP